jgi:uncharacterized Ntn-hydrolase superfamily protein
MTFSVLAMDRVTGAMGAAAATGNLAVGAWVLRAAAGVGAVATQGERVSALWGDTALARLAAGEDPEAIVAALAGVDPGREARQLAVLDARGRGAAFTGSDNRDRKGHTVGVGLVVAGNCLAGDEILPAMAAALDIEPDTGGELATRLLRALEAAARAGGDARGLQSAALQVVARDRPPLDLRIDHAEAPIEALGRLLALASRPDYRAWTATLPTLDDPFRR